MFEPVKDEIAYIAENGCLVFYKGELLYKAAMDREYGLSLIRRIESIPDCEVVVSGVDCNYIKPKDSEFYNYMLTFVKTNTKLIDDLALVPEDYFKISAFGANGTKAFEDILQKEFGEVLNVVTSGLRWVDVMPKNVHKGSAIRVLSEKLSIPLEDMAALGDHYNDLEILDMVGHPMCVENAMPEIKAMCEQCWESGAELLSYCLKQ